MYTDTIIANMALGHVGTAGNIDSVTSDQHPNAEAVREYYDVALRITLRAFTWPFARRIRALTLLETLDPKVYQWQYRYQKPVDSIKFVKINSDIRNDTRQSRVPHKIFVDGIYTDRVDAVGQWIVGNVTEDMFEDDFALALSYRLAHLIAPRVTRGDDFRKGQSALKYFDQLIADAKANAANEEQEEEDPLSEFERARF